MIGTLIVSLIAMSQLAYAGVLSIFYTIVMMLALVGIIRGAAENGFCSVSTTFLLGVVGVFVVTALLHPMECTAILHGFLYFLSIPSMSMLLLIYSLANLHNVSWGTREVSVLENERSESSKALESRVLKGHKEARVLDKWGDECPSELRRSVL